MKEKLSSDERLTIAFETMIQNVLQQQNRFIVKHIVGATSLLGGAIYLVGGAILEFLPLQILGIVMILYGVYLTVFKK